MLSQLAQDLLDTFVFSASMSPGCCLNPSLRFIGHICLDQTCAHKMVLLDCLARIGYPGLVTHTHTRCAYALCHATTQDHPGPLYWLPLGVVWVPLWSWVLLGAVGRAVGCFKMVLGNVGCFWVLLGVVGQLGAVGHCWVLMHRWAFLVLLGVVGCCWTLLCVVGGCWVLLGTVGHCWVLLGIVGCYIELLQVN